MRDQRGQTLILMLIVTVVSLTVGVAISSRAVSTLKQTSYTAQAGKAQKFADAGVEEALGAADLSALATTCPDAGTPCTIDFDGDLNPDVNYYVTESGNETFVELSQVEKDTTHQIDLSVSGLTTIDVEWDSAAIVVYSIIKKDSAGNVTLEQKGATDPVTADGCDLASSDPLRTPGTSPYDHKINIGSLSVDPSADEELYIRLRPMACSNVSTNIKISTSGVNLPNQGYTITSTGTYGEAEWTAEVTKMNPALPAIFDYAIFSDTNLTK